MRGNAQIDVSLAYPVMKEPEERLMETGKHQFRLSGHSKSLRAFGLLFACGTSLLLAETSIHAADDALTDLRLYNYKAANPGAAATNPDTGSNGTAAESGALSSATADMLDTTATTANQPAGKKRKASPSAMPEVPVNPKTPSVDSQEKLLNVQDDFGLQNRPEANLDFVAKKKALNDDRPPGIHVGTFLLRPTLSQSINRESTTTRATATTTASDKHRGFLETGYTAELQSDWDVHELRLTSAGAYQKNISGTGTTKPRFDIGGVLRLDISRDTTARFNAAYGNARVDATDPNPVLNALAQAPADTYTAGGEIEQKFGRFRATAGVDLNRTTYGKATLSDGTLLSLQDRDQTMMALRGRLGYEITPGLIPYVEASLGRITYDDAVDLNGYNRSGKTSSLRAGLQVTPDEKLTADLGAGIKRTDFEDARLATINAFAVDGNATWSIRRGTDVTLGIKTTIDPSTEIGVNGSVTYGANASLSHRLSENLTARMRGEFALRNNPDISTMGDETILAVGTGLSWSINRYVDLTSDLAYEKTTSTQNNNSSVMRVGVGLTLKR